MDCDHGSHLIVIIVVTSVFHKGIEWSDFNGASGSIARFPL